MKEDIVQAVRDGIEENGELVTYKDVGVHDADIWLHISYGVEVYTDQGTQKVIAARGMKEDLSALSSHGKFVTADDRKFKFMKTLKDDGYSVMMSIGEIPVA